MRVVAPACLLLTLMNGACSLIVDTRIAQCRTDGDCAAVGGLCDRATQLCVARIAPGAGGNSGNQPAGPGEGAGDAQTTPDLDAGPSGGDGPTSIGEGGGPDDAQPFEVDPDLAGAGNRCPVTAPSAPSCASKERSPPAIP